MVSHSRIRVSRGGLTPEREPDFAATGVIYSMAELIRRAEAATGAGVVPEAGAC